MSRDVAQYIKIAKIQFANDIKAGILPETIETLSEAHDHTDANYYGSFTDSRMATWVTTELAEWNDEGEDGMPEDLQDFTAEVLDALAEWVEGGMKE